MWKNYSDLFKFKKIFDLFKFKMTTTCEVNSLYELIKRFPNKPWDWDALSENPNITWEFVYKNHT